MSPVKAFFSVLTVLLITTSLNAQVVKTNSTAGIAAGDSIHRKVTYVSGVDFPPGALVTDVNVSITWDDPNPLATFSIHQETMFALTSPSGRYVVLVYDGDNNHGRGPSIAHTYDGLDVLPGPVTVTFDEDAAVALGPLATNPVSGTFRTDNQVPADDLDLFDGETPFGDWTLIAWDESAGTGDIGFQSFSLELSGPALPSNSPPVAANDTVATPVDSAILVNVQLNDSDPDGDSITTSIVIPPGNGTAILLGNDIQYIPNPGYLGVDSVKYVICDTAGACDTAFVYIYVGVPIPGTCTEGSITIDPSDTSACPGEAITFGIDTADSVTAIVWQVSTDGGTSFSNLSDGGAYSGTVTDTLSISPLMTSMDGYQYRAVINGCIGPVDTSVAATLLPDPISPVANCNDLTLQLIPGTTPLTPAEVDAGSTDNCAVDSLSLDMGSFTCADLGSQSVNLTVTDASGNSASCIAIVEVVDTIGIGSPPLFLPGNIDICPGGSVLLDAGVAYDAYLWSTGDTTQNLLVTTPGLYSVTVTDIAGCTTGSSSDVGFHPVPNPTVIDGGDSLYSSVGGVSYQWFDPLGVIPGAVDSFYVPDANGDYSVLVTDMNGCEGISDTLSFLVGIEKNTLVPQLKVYPNPTQGVVNIQTPDGFGPYIPEIKVLNLLGQQVQITILSHSEETIRIDMRHLGIGMYFLSIEMDQQSFIQKIHKE